MKLFCDIRNATVPHLVCIYNCTESEKIECAEYTKRYEELKAEPISEFYLAKYGEPSYPLPASIARKVKLATKKERDKEKKDKELEKTQKRKLKAKKKEEKELAKLEKIKLREDKKTAKMLKKGITKRVPKIRTTVLTEGTVSPEAKKRGRPRKTEQITTLAPAIEQVLQQKKRGRPKKVVQVTDNKFFM